MHYVSIFIVEGEFGSQKLCVAPIRKIFIGPFECCFTNEQ